MILISSGLCAILSAVVLMNNELPPSASGTREGRSAHKLSVRDSPTGTRPSRASAAGRAAATKPLPVGTATISAADINALSIRNLLIPVAGVSSGQLHDSFYDSRSEGRIHKALDIMAPRDTPVLATGDGIVLKLHQSDRGGIMLYQSDASGTYVYYYGHLTRYAEGISEGKPVSRGEVIAFVGDTGNAGAGNYHLHFGISRMTQAGRWSGGEPINPYPLLTENGARSSIGASE